MTKVSRAIILAAGRGARMGNRGTMMPKGLLTVGNKSLIERSLNSLFDSGIDDATIVTGHLAEAFAPIKQRYGRRLSEVFNRDYAQKLVVKV